MTLIESLVEPESADPDVSELWNQMAAEQHLDVAVRKTYREEFSCLPFVPPPAGTRGSCGQQDHRDRGYVP